MGKLGVVHVNQTPMCQVWCLIVSNPEFCPLSYFDLHLD